MLYLAAAGRPLLRLAALGLWRLVEVPVALLLLFWEWGWRPLSALLARLARLRIVARLESWIVSLPPYPALAMFALPAVALLPLKLLALWLIAGGHALQAALLFVAAKVIGTALVARLFALLRPKLMTIGWFRRGYDLVMPWKEHVFTVIRSSWAWRYGRILKDRVARLLRRLIEETLRPAVRRLATALRELLRSSTSVK